MKGRSSRSRDSCLAWSEAMPVSSASYSQCHRYLGASAVPSLAGETSLSSKMKIGSGPAGATRDRTWLGRG